uniref:Uncharacterized protein n=1 Tax=Leviviridae sp. TaxID=2027243 RepID=A0A514D5V6_9VIRU|nr:MAG: hypothetical protein H4Bulk47234_000003 [Leviviridae sp.]
MLTVDQVLLGITIFQSLIAVTLIGYFAFSNGGKPSPKKH